MDSIPQATCLNAPPQQQAGRRKRLTTASDRAHAVQRRNQRERNRVKRVNQALAQLRTRVPEFSGLSTHQDEDALRPAHKKMSKVETLRAAAEYIRQLQALLASHDAGSDATIVPDLQIKQETFEPMEPMERMERLEPTSPESYLSTSSTTGSLSEPNYQSLTNFNNFIHYAESGTPTYWSPNTHPLPAPDTHNHGSHFWYY